MRGLAEPQKEGQLVVEQQIGARISQIWVVDFDDELGLLCELPSGGLSYDSGTDFFNPIRVSKVDAQTNPGKGGRSVNASGGFAGHPISRSRPLCVAAFLLTLMAFFIIAGCGGRGGGNSTGSATIAGVT